MRAVNHVLTGSVFAAASASQLPVAVILPAAFLLHFVLDALPHFGSKGLTPAGLEKQKWLVPLDGLLGLIVFIIILAAQPDEWLLMIAAGALCASPDLWSFWMFRHYLRTGEARIPTGDWFTAFHVKIQWMERPWGIWIELAWAGLFCWLLAGYLQ